MQVLYIFQSIKQIYNELIHFFQDTDFLKDNSYQLIDPIQEIQIQDRIKLLLLMKFLGCTAEVNASGNGSETFEICSMIKNVNNPDQFVTIAHDGMITIWNSKTMKIVTSARIKCGYLTSLINFQNGFIVGTGSGEIMKFSSKLERQWTRKIHHDCVTDMLQTQQEVVSIGSDGRVCFIQKEDFTIKKQLDLCVPLSKITKINNEIYVSGNPSFKINLNNLQVHELKRSFQFAQFDGKILSCSDEKGLEILGAEEHNENIPCHYMLPFYGKLVAISEQIIGLIDFHKSSPEQQEISYRFYKALQLKKGYAIKTGLAFEDSIILAGQEGFIYKFKFQI